jgi:hypothetical protein
MLRDIALSIATDADGAVLKRTQVARVQADGLLGVAVASLLALFDPKDPTKVPIDQLPIQSNEDQDRKLSSVATTLRNPVKAGNKTLVPILSRLLDTPQE